MANQNRENEFNIFDWMDRYKVPILLVILAGMAFFGVIGYLIDLFRGESEQEKRAKEVVTSYEVGGEQLEVTRADIRNHDIRSEPEAEFLIGNLIRNKLADVVDPHVSDAEFREALDSVKEFIRTNNEGTFDLETYTKFCNSMRMTPQGFEERLRKDMRQAKLMRELDRCRGHVSSNEMLEQHKKENQKIKLTGVFWDPAKYTEKLARDEDGNFTDEAKQKVIDHFNGLDDDQKRRFHTGGAVISAEFVGFNFRKYEDAAALEAAFKAVNDGAKGTLEELTADFTPTEDDFAKLKLRYERTRLNYGDDGSEDLDTKFEEHKPRLVMEWKILKLMKRLHDEVTKDAKAGNEVDFAVVARENNLFHGNWTDRKVLDLVSDEEFPGVYVYTLQGSKENEIFTWNTGVGPNTSSLFRGPVDEVSKHASIFRLLAKDLRPIANIEDPEVLDKVAEDLEMSTAKESLEADVALFEKAMTDFLEAIPEVAEARTEARKEADENLAKELDGLDPEKDADKIEELKAKFDDEVEAAVDDAKDEHRGKAFDHVVANLPGKATVVTEGFFDARLAPRESALEGDDWPSEQIAGNLLRRQFNELHDQPYADKYIDVGTVGDIKDLRTRRGWKGIAKLVEKKQPTLEDLFLRPMLLGQAERRVTMLANPSGRPPSMWDWSSLKTSGFNLDTAKIEAAIREEVDREAEEERKLEELKKIREDRQKKKREEQQAEMEKRRKEAEEADKAATKPAAPADEKSADEDAKSDG